MVKFTTAGAEFKLLMVWWIFPEPEVAPMVIPGGNGRAVQVKRVPGTEEFRIISAVFPEQITREGGDAVMLGCGCTVTFMLPGFEAVQPSGVV